MNAFFSKEGSKSEPVVLNWMFHWVLIVVLQYGAGSFLPVQHHLAVKAIPVSKEKVAKIEFGSISSYSYKVFIKNNRYEIGKANATAVHQYFNRGALPAISPFN